MVERQTHHLLGTEVDSMIPDRRVQPRSIVKVLLKRARQAVQRHLDRLSSATYTTSVTIMTIRPLVLFVLPICTSKGREERGLHPWPGSSVVRERAREGLPHRGCRVTCTSGH